jgi:UDP-N-acetylmuramoyl-L-alanyl-D-glutamate--2,6-diaminopimelate ligase
MKMKLKKLLKDIAVKEIKGSAEIEIAGICSNSKLVFPGSLFIARKGKSDDGEKYIPEALSAGAVAIVTDMGNPSLKNVTQIIHHDVALIEGLIAANYYQFPSDELLMVGITGTNGKTTTSFLVKYLLDSLKKQSGLIGTIEYIIGDHRYPATRTTPDVINNHKMLREMVLNGCKAAIMEVSSHALDQSRVQNIDFDIAIFTNLTLDHLDYHETMENYAEAKAKLFSSLNSSKQKKKLNLPAKVAIVNSDSPWFKSIIKGCKEKVLTYGIENQSDIQASNIKLTAFGTTFDLTYEGRRVSCKSPLIGRFNVYNYMAAVAVGLSLKEPLSKIAEIMAGLFLVPGRLEPVENCLGFKIYVDFAHSDDALENVLKCLLELKEKKIITVFGCGGDRDKSKRSKMAEISEKFSDYTIVTSDNPRGENPSDIINDIVKGFKTKSSFEIIIDRHDAIAKAIDIAKVGDIILIAGKGHETYQITGAKTMEFDDRKVAFEIAHNKTSQLEVKQC